MCYVVGMGVWPHTQAFQKAEKLEIFNIENMGMGQGMKQGGPGDEAGRAGGRSWEGQGMLFDPVIYHSLWST